MKQDGILYDGIPWYPSYGYKKYFRNYKYGLLHIYKYKKEIGTIKKGCEIHHKDFNPHNNNLNNLIMLTKSEHMKLHREYEWKNKKRNNSGKNHPKYREEGSIWVWRDRVKTKRDGKIVFLNKSQIKELQIDNLFRTEC